ncbi:MAG TPA: Gfo/Idh/MocA family oxidoreductase [Anaeromyxobacter sp.]|nr:Gfo/Idh/MocA family oxidoreductase [Anaeromyxobacter sp.]
MGAGAGPSVAIVGCGQIADAHVQQARRAGGCVVAVCDRSAVMAEQAAARLGVPVWYDDLGEMLARARPDVVHVTTPPASHLAVARAALERGAHVYVEKPFAVDLAEASALEEAARRAGRLACAGHNLAFDPVVLRLRRLVEDGALGDVVHVDAMMSYNLAGPFGALAMSDPDHWVHRLPGGIAQNNLSHPLSIALPLLGDGVPAVHAAGARLRRERFGDARDEFHDELRMLLSGERATASIQFSCHARPVQLAVTVRGTRGEAAVSLEARTLRVVRGSSMPGPFQKVDWARNDAVEAGRELLHRAGDLARARLHYFEGMRELFARFYAAAAGTAAPPVPLEEARRTTAVLDEVFRQCRAGRRAETPPALVAEGRAP